MVRYAQLVMGPAGSGKSTYCDYLSKYCEEMNRSVKLVNLDPAAEFFKYPVTADVRDLIQLDDVMDDESLSFGPNGGLVFCLEYINCIQFSSPHQPCRNLGYNNYTQGTFPRTLSG